MNVFIIYIVYVASFFALVLVTVACLYALVAACRRALCSQELLAAQLRQVQRQSQRCEFIADKLAATAFEAYEAEIDEVYRKQADSEPTAREA